jgi:formate dehydrogenase alpha subunit
MVKAAEEKKLKALFIMGENPLRSLPQPDRVKEALKNLDFIVVQDILSTETTEIADVVLPGAAFCEKEGSFTNFEGRIQFFKNAVNPPGHAKPDWEILDILIEQCKMPFRYSSIKNIRNEIKSLISLYEDFNEDNGHVWLKDSDKKKSSQEGFRIPFFNISSIERNTKDVSYPFTAIIGSMRHHLGSGTRTGNSERISESENNSRIEISTNDAIDLNLKDGDAILIKSSYGTIQREVKIKGGLNPGIIFIPTGFNNNNAMNIVKLASYEEQDWEGIKTIDVSIEKKI